MPSFKADPSFDDLAPTNSKGGIIAKGAGASYLAVPVGSDNLFLKADSSASQGISWGSPAGANLGIANLIGATTLTSSNDIVLVSGTTFAVSLPNSVGIEGKIIEVQKVDAGFITPISLKGITSAQTIGGFAGVTLSTQWESFQVKSIGTSGWLVRDHYIDGSWANGISLSPQGFGTPSSTIWRTRRSGSNLEGQGYFKAGTSGASPAMIMLPTGINIDTSANGYTSGWIIYPVGSFYLNASGAFGANSLLGPLAVNGATPSAMFFSQSAAGNTAMVVSTASTMAGTNQAIDFSFSVSIQGWAG